MGSEMCIRDRPSSFDAPSPVRQEPAIVEQKPRSRWPWILLVLGLIGAAIAGVVIAQLTATDTDPVADSDPDPVVVVEDEPEPDIARQFQPLNDDAFLQPDTAHGVIFDVVRNSSGLTMVGGAGDGESSACLLYTSPSPRDGLLSRMPSSA